MNEEMAGPLSFNVVAGTEAEAEDWAETVMGLTRRLWDQAEAVDQAETPFKLSVTFLVPGPLVEVDWTGVRLGRLSKRYGVLAADAAIDMSASNDRVGEVVRLAKEAVDAAEAYAKRRKKADGLSAIRAALHEMESAGPAPRESPSRSSSLPQSRAIHGEPPLLRGTLSTGGGEVDPSEGMLELWLEDIWTGAEQSLLLERLDGDRGTLLLSKVRRSVRFERKDVVRPSVVASTADPDLAVETLMAWAFNDEALPADLRWRRA